MTAKLTSFVEFVFNTVMEAIKNIFLALLITFICIAFILAGLVATVAQIVH